MLIHNLIASISLDPIKKLSKRDIKTSTPDFLVRQLQGVGSVRILLYLHKLPQAYQLDHLTASTRIFRCKPVRPCHAFLSIYRLHY